MTVKLPERYFQELEQIQANIADQQIDLAMPRALRLFQDYPTFDSNKLLVHSLLLNGDDEIAMNYLEDFKQQYQAKTELVNDVLATLLEHHAFILARQLNFELDLNSNETIEIAENAYQVSNPKGIAALTRAVSSCGTLGIEEQSVTLRRAKYLPLSSYKVAVQLVLQDLDVWQPVKSDVLQALKLIGFTDKVVVTGEFQNGEPIDLKNISAEIQGVEFKQIKEIIWKQIGAVDPIKWQMAEKELFLQSAYLYPLAGKIISDREVWAQLMIQKLNDKQPIITNDVEQHLLEIQEQLEQKIQRDLEF